MASTPPHEDAGSAATGFLVGVLVAALAGAGAVQADVIDVSRAGAQSASGSGSDSAGPKPSAQDFETVYADVSNGVVRLSNTRCADEGGATGSGALLSEDLVATAAHVVAGHSHLQLMLGDQTATGQVIGYDEESDLALVRASRPLVGHVFEPVTEPTGVGADVAAIGYPLSGPLSMAGPGIVSTYGESSTYPWWDGSQVTITDLMRTTVPTNAGNSGGPLVDRTGALVGLVSGTRTSQGTVDEQGGVDVRVVEGYKYAVPAGRVSELTEQWRTTPEPLQPRECEAPSEPAPLELVTAQTGGPDTEAVTAVLFDYFDGINREDYERAYRQLSEERRNQMSLERFTQEQSSSIVSNVVVLETRREGEDLHALATFTSVQAPELGPDGLPCAFWLLDYRFVDGGEHGWSIAESSELPDQPRFEACSD